MKIQKIYSNKVTNGKVVNKKSGSLKDAYSCDYTNNILYPVGSVYTSIDESINPSILYGGVWELQKEIIDTGWQNFSWINSIYTNFSQVGYALNKWRVKDNVLYISIGVGAAAAIDSSNDIEISRVPMKGNTSFNENTKRIWTGAVGGFGATAGFSILQNAEYISVILKPHENSMTYAASWYAAHFSIPLDDSMEFSSGNYETRYIWTRIS